MGEADSVEAERQGIGELVAVLAESSRRASADEARRIRLALASVGLPEGVTERVRMKHRQHVEERSEWPDDVTPEGYLTSLRATLLDDRADLAVCFEPDLDDWVIYVSGPVRRAWRGRRAGQRVVVLFRRDPLRWITGFQARDGTAYVARQGGTWIYTR